MSDAPVQLLDTQQVAQYCGVTPSAVEEWLRKGLLTSELKDAQQGVRPSVLVHFMHQNLLAIPAELLQAEQDSGPQPVRVLVVDEDRPMAMNIERVLRNMGLEVIQVNSGGDARGAYHQHKPTLMTLDLTLEGVRGVDLIESVRTPPSHRAKILVITDSMPSLISKARQAGADAVLNKPFDNDALRRNVRILLGIS